MSQFRYAGRFGPVAFIREDTLKLLKSTDLTVYDVGTTDAVTLYADRDKTPVAGNDFTTDGDGNGTFFAEPGEYDVAYVVGGVELWRKTVPVLVDPREAVESAEFDVRDYGAVGDGVTDDASAIQDALDAAEAAGGGVVTVPSGSFLLGTRLELVSGLVFSGAGLLSTVLKPDASLTTAVLTGLGADAITNVTLKSFKVDGNSATAASSVTGIQISSGSAITVEDVWIDDAPDNGMAFSGCDNVTVRNCLVSASGAAGANGHGIQATSGSNVLIESNWVTKCGGMGIRCDTVVQLRILGNHVNQTDADLQAGGSNGLECIGVTSTCADVLVQANLALFGVDNNISVSCDEAVVSNNYAEGAQFHGIAIAGDDVVIIGNHTKNNGQVGGAPTYGGIALTAGNTRCVIVGNRSWDDQGTKTQDYGIKESIPATRCLIVGNQLDGNLTEDLHANFLSSGDHWVAGNTDGPTRINSGTEAIPALAFVSDPDTGLYNPSANLLGLVTAATEWWRLSSAGKLQGRVFANAGSEALSVQVTGDTEERFLVFANGKLEWGGGSGARDTNLYRSSGNLKTDDKLLVVGGLGVGNSASGSSLGSLVKKMEVFDATGASLGFLPIYDAIS